MHYSKKNQKQIKITKLKASQFLISKTKLLFTISLLTLLIISCSGEDGSDGINGISGEQGPSGQDGADGTDGTNGNANVKTGIATLNAADWLCCETYSLDTSEGVSLNRDARYVNLNIPEITEDIHLYGLVLVYFTPTGKYDSWVQLPYSIQSIFGDYDFLFEASINQIRLLHFINPIPADFLNVAVTYPIETRQFKYIIIEGEAIEARNTSGKTMDHQQKIKNKLISDGVDISNYEDVLDYYGIHE